MYRQLAMTVSITSSISCVNAILVIAIGEPVGLLDRRRRRHAQNVRIGHHVHQGSSPAGTPAARSSSAGGPPWQSSTLRPAKSLFVIMGQCKYHVVRQGFRFDPP